MKSWEYTVNKIFQSNPENIMLEYTATVELTHPAVAKKYANKIIYQYTLANFREDGFSKDVGLLQSDWAVKDRALQAVILSQYRRKVAEKNKIQLKPVILFKSKQIKDSQDFEQQFYQMIKELKAADIRRILSDRGEGVMDQAYSYFTGNKIDFNNLAKEIKEEFAPEKCLIINSKADSEEKQIKVNTLEDYNNEIRAIFTTNMLNEGWDVLNLFDIVRLYETRDAKSGKAGSATVSEAQLIGRGARYYPFKVENRQVADRRKYDKDLNNELRVLEELHYHSLTDTRYIAELHNELVNIGIAPSNRKILNVAIKDSVKKTPFWKDGLVFINKFEKKNYAKVKDLRDVVENTTFTHKIKAGKSAETGIFEEQQALPETINKKTIKLSDIEKHILRKAFDKLDFFQFENIIRFFPRLRSVDEFLTSDSYAGLVKVELSARNGKLDPLTNTDKLEICLGVIKEISGKISASNNEFIGTKEFFGQSIKLLARDKKLEILTGGDDKEFGIAMRETLNDDLRLNLAAQNWYMYDENYGTSEEKHLVQFIRQAMDELQKTYKDIYLLRNEKLFKIYRFSDGQAIEPDFVLFLKNKKTQKAISYQLFIEAKGNRGLIEDKWKEDFLREIETTFKLETLFEKQEYRLIGLPFFNAQQTRQQFDEAFRQKLNL
jgi:type III restriction enzyme